ncbi:MAG TPA: RHS repeat-associated core domain-containing protein [Candidatus Dojkabacteria bacterium]|nr:RHS repeat-associated core domain-containing protein [Candidatus Dojkabacteria bacterium]
MKRENTLYYHTDHLGSSGYVTDKKGEFYEHTEYTSSGESWVNEKVTGNANLPFKYTSKEMDAETGLYYYGARYYDARTSRFISADDRIDGLFSTQGWNIYSYVQNNPINMIDPDGHQSVSGFIPINFYENKEFHVDYELNENGGNIHLQPKNGKRDKYYLGQEDGKFVFRNEKGVKYNNSAVKELFSDKQFVKKFNRAFDLVQNQGGFKYKKSWLKFNPNLNILRGVAFLSIISSSLGVVQDYKESGSISESIKRLFENIVDGAADPFGIPGGEREKRQQERLGEDYLKNPEKYKDVIIIWGPMANTNTKAKGFKL